ncbi:uncharacterized protein [Spinacia oleracea]|uniref:Uncharacterized protein isoform X2 n=1 Tax=Spinacia oleracea TaxID=3562 RepID=A0ABM3RNE7_SPIOL|nr:uncharacterized protein LOC110780536 isoform X2 [Spinacia oleracea]XP_056697135.1 uncharacterized protein LOC110796656 isoform X2 [Spinacia oleracea]
MSRNYQHQTRQKPTILRPNQYLLPTHRRHEKQRLTVRRPMFVMKKNMDMKMIEKLHDCFILDFNPYEQKSCSFKKYDGVYITAEKGQVALKDYPHPRHLCTRYPFHKTPHSKFCSRLPHANTGQLIVMLQIFIRIGVFCASFRGLSKKASILTFHLPSAILIDETF